MKKFEKNIKKRMLDLGITKDHFKTGFKEFNILDMYGYNGKACFYCAKGRKCPKHGLKRVDKPMDERAFYDLYHP